MRGLSKSWPGSASLGKSSKQRDIGNTSNTLRAENLIWIFGAARTGSTWLSRMLRESKGHHLWNEPLVGALFGNLYYKRAKHRIDERVEHYILGEAFRESWLDSIRTFVLKEAR
jgi:hypothetical protein